MLNESDPVAVKIVNLMNPLIRHIKSIEARLPQAMGADRHALARELTALRSHRAKDQSVEKRLEALGHLAGRVTESIKRREQRRSMDLNLSFDEQLPICAKKEEIIATLGRHRVLIISGETGSGKTTQIPKFCLAAGRGVDGFIGCTQPRRIAAVTVAERIRAELGDAHGDLVGYKIRFTDRTRPQARIKIMTDGILLAETRQDPFLNPYDTLIVDEAHERSLNIDFVLGILKTLLAKRRDLNLVVTSATIDTAKFSKAFDDAPIIEVSGRMYPVTLRYTAESDLSATEEQTYVEMAADAVGQLLGEKRGGDILVFMPTEQDIRETCDLLAAREKAGLTILPLFARLSAADQAAVFRPAAGRKVIVATNVAETSITIPGIRYVVDTGLARISRYSPRTRTTSLPVAPISRSSADQRKGRCGRMSDGICIRLFTEADYESRPLYTPPEILRANLADVVLRMVALKLGDIEHFPFIDGPPAKSIKDGFDLLLELGAIEQSRSRRRPAADPNRFGLTPYGRLMSRLPLDPRLSRMLITAEDLGCPDEILVIAAALSIQDPRERPAEKDKEADQAHARFVDPQSDFITLLNIWQAYDDLHETDISNSRRKRFCRDHFLSFRRMREWRDIHDQIRTIRAESGKSPSPRSKAVEPSKDSRQQEPFSPVYTAIHKSVLSGFLSNIALKKEKNLYRAGKGREVMLFPGSGLFNRGGAWIVAAEMVETSRLFARMAANIDSVWLEEIGGDRCKITYLDPRWERKAGKVMADAQVSLYGLIIVPRRPVAYGPVNPGEASEIFVRQALVAGDLRQPFDFMAHNQALIDDIRGLEDRFRRRDLLVAEEDLADFYLEKLHGVFDIRGLKKRMQDHGGDDFLKIGKDDLMRYAPDEAEVSAYPERLPLGGEAFDCTYHFAPGETQDGVTLNIPAAKAAKVPADALQWLVPGLLKEKITALIKGLPKHHRKKLVPIGPTVDLIVEKMPREPIPLANALSRFVAARLGHDIPASVWAGIEVPAHLKMRVSLKDANGREIKSGRDPAVLAQPVKAGEPDNAIAAAKKTWEKLGLITWDFGDLPASVTLDCPNRRSWTGYPGLSVEGSPPEISLRLFESPAAALAPHKAGVAALLRLALARDIKLVKKNLILPEDIAHLSAACGGLRAFNERFMETLLDDCLKTDIRTRSEFAAKVESAPSEIYETGRRKLDLILPVLEALHETRSLLGELETAHARNPVALGVLHEIAMNLSRLVPKNFFGLYADSRLAHLPRFIRAAGIRARRGVDHPEKDQSKAALLGEYTRELDSLIEDIASGVSAEKQAALEELFWLIQEYKVSLFAQELKTAVPVSAKRLSKKVAEIRRMI